MATAPSWSVRYERLVRKMSGTVQQPWPIGGAGMARESTTAVFNRSQLNLLRPALALLLLLLQAYVEATPF